MFGRRARVVAALLAILVFVGAATRAAIALRLARHLDAAEIAQALWSGVGPDALVGVILVAPIAAILALVASETDRPRLRFALVTAFAAAAVFAGFVEYSFFEEFDARFNHVALDYLLFPGEVAGNVWESYPVPVYALAALLLGAALAYAVERFVRAAAPAAPRRRLAAGATPLVAGGLACVALSFVPPRDSGDRERDEVASNGLVQLVRAFQSAGLDYESYYHVLPDAALARRSQEELGFPDLAAPEREFRAVERRERPLDVVVILGESFGAEFVGRLGGPKDCTPGFDRWSGAGLLLSNLVATGNRTVRGLEGVLCSFVPLPGDSIWKRDKSDDVATIARVLKDRGYRTEFVYGGDGAFDSMRSFATRNGWDAFHEDSLVGASSYPEDAFRTVWGVADEHAFAKLLERQRAAHDAGVPFLGTALTVSNHKPFLTPDTRAAGLRGDKLRAAAWQGALLAAASFLGWKLVARRGRRTATAVVLGTAWIAFGAYSWIKVQPRDTREAAVRYADRALAEYLDRARDEGLLEHTVVLFVGDHGARVYGSEEIPAASYRVPALFLAPDARWRGVEIPRLCSQVDLAPTLLSLAGVDFSAPFFGDDLLAGDPDAPGRAWLIHNRSVGFLTDAQLTVLGLHDCTTVYRRSDRSSDRFEAVATGEVEPDAADRAAAAFQAASLLYESERYRLGDAR